MKKIFIFITLFAVLLTGREFSSYASSDEETKEDEVQNEPIEVISKELEGKIKSAILMEASTGKILYAKNEREALPPASVTKIMTLLLVSEAIDNNKINLNDKVSVSKNAAEMGGSQIFLKEGEEFTVEELIKCTVIASANDAAVALAELICGSESEFVDLMNKRAVELGLRETVFENCTGLDDTVEKHLTSARDIALMSRELIKHQVVLKYSNVWQDSIRNGEFILTNTNRLVRYYKGCTGLKTGSTDKAGFCLSATATRGGMDLIAVVMGAQTRDMRNTVAKSLLDYGFSHFALYTKNQQKLESAPIYYAKLNNIDLYAKDISFLISKDKLKEIEISYDIPSQISAPVNKNEVVGKVTYKIDDEIVGTSDIVVIEQVDKLNILDSLIMLINLILCGKK